MNRTNITLVIALALTVSMSATVIVLQQMRISSLRKLNEQQSRAAGVQTRSPADDIPGRYRWFENGVERGFITLNPDRGAAGLSGKLGWDGTLSRWFYQDGELAVIGGASHTVFTQASGPGNYSGKEGKKSIQIIKEP